MYVCRHFVYSCRQLLATHLTCMPTVDGCCCLLQHCNGHLKTLCIMHVAKSLYLGFTCIAAQGQVKYPYPAGISISWFRAAYFFLQAEACFRNPAVRLDLSSGIVYLGHGKIAGIDMTCVPNSTVYLLIEALPNSPEQIWRRPNWQQLMRNLPNWHTGTQPNSWPVGAAANWTKNQQNSKWFSGTDSASS